MSSGHGESQFPKGGVGPNLKKYLEKRISVKLNANRHVVGVLRGFDTFMNIVLDNTVEIANPTTQNQLGTVVIRSNSIVSWECIDKVQTGSGLY